MKLRFICSTLAALLIIGCNNKHSVAAPPASDNEILLEACKLMKAPEERTLCAEAAERVGRQSHLEQQKGAELPSKFTTEPITFKGIPLDKPGVKEALQEMCRQEITNMIAETCSHSSDKMCREEGMNAIKKDESSGDSPCVFKERTIHPPVSYGILSKADGWLVLGDDGSLLSVQISGSKGEYALAEVEVLEAKYGKPSKTTTQVENKMGTKFDKDIFVWQDSQGSRITVESMYDKIDEGRIVIESASTVAVEKEAEKVKKKIGKLNL